MLSYLVGSGCGAVFIVAIDSRSCLRACVGRSPWLPRVDRTKRVVHVWFLSCTNLTYVLIYAYYIYIYMPT